MRIAVLASHGGSLLQALLDACDSRAIDGEVVLVISNNRGSGALQRATAVGVPCTHFSAMTHPEPTSLDRAIADALDAAGADLVVLAGYMKRLGSITLERYRGKLINTHPALLPKHGGQGFYGSRVHAAVLATGDVETGATVHYVQGDYDTGPVIEQRRLAVLPNDTVEALEERVKALERKLLVETVAQLAREHSLVLVRVLRPTDVDAFRRVRLSALQREPTAFSSSFEIELAQPDKFRERLRGATDSLVMGAFVSDELVGIAGFHREVAPKRRHAGTVTGMFVDEHHRGRGVGRRLLDAIVQHARSLEGLEQLELSVTAGNVPARRLYEALGFRAWGTQPRALRVANVDYAEDHMLLELHASEGG
jgi:phosphoribosylglycinamide formyltransferase 1